MSLKPDSISSYSKPLQNLFQQLSIRKKIVCGYALSLGVAILGTTGGLIVGDGYFQSAQTQIDLTHQKASLLSGLQGEILEIHAHQQEILSTFGKKQALGSSNLEWQDHSQEMEELFSQLKTLNKTRSNDELQNLLQRYETDIKKYFQNLEQLSQQSLLLSSNPENIQTAQQIIWNFYQDSSTQKFYHYSHDLADFNHKIYKIQQQNNLAYEQAKTIQAQIIIISMMLSVIIAMILAFYTSRIITNPLNTVINIADKVTQEKNFELQVPISTQDEIGTLSHNLNQLIKQVQNLLEIQQNEAQSKLIQSEKMSSLGEMVAGVAHEINNPINFISGNLEHAENYIKDLLYLIEKYQELIPEPPAEINSIVEEIDLAFIETDLPKIINSMTIGTERTREIVRSLKSFSRLDEGKITLIDLHSCIESTLLILNNRIKNSIQIIYKFGDIPHVYGYMGLLYQVFMNIISNAIDALEEKSHDNPQFAPEITITTENYDQNWVLIKIADNGPGIQLDNQQKIFENFFTTKPRGVGTGLGLAISYQIVVEKHQGKISCCSELDQGTEFTIILPIEIPAEDPSSC